MRLEGSEAAYQGRLEICHNGTWGTVCSHGFDNRDARVACRGLGLGLVVVSLPSSCVIYVVFYSCYLLQLLWPPCVADADIIFVAAEWKRAGHYICCPVVCSSFYLSIFFPRLISAVADWMSTILAHMSSL